MRISPVSRIVASLLLVCPLLYEPPAEAMLITHADVTIDKPSYSSTYAIGVEASTDGPADTVVVTHSSDSSDAAGTWSLSSQDGGLSWWNWSPGRPRQSRGPLGGDFSILATDISGSTAALDGSLPSDAELDYVRGDYVRQTSRGYELGMSAVFGAAYYNIWVWDPVQKIYPWSFNRFVDPSQSTLVPYDKLVVGRTYNVYYMANRPLVLGDAFSGLFRSYSLLQFTDSPITVPEPASLGLLLGGLALLCCSGALGRGSGRRASVPGAQS